MPRCSSLILALPMTTAVVAQTPPPSPAPAPSPPPAPTAANAVINIVQKSFNTGDMIVLDGSTSVGDSFSWTIVPASPNFWVPPGPGDMAAFSSGTPETFTVILSTALDGTISTAQQVVTVGTPPAPPAPTPPDPPAPPAPPTPTVKNVWAVTIDDATARTPATAKVLGDLAYWAKFTAAGNNRSELDANNPAAAAYANYVSQAGGMPALVLLDKATNKVLATVKLPNTGSAAGDEAAIDALVAKLTGGATLKR